MGNEGKGGTGQADGGQGDGTPTQIEIKVGEETKVLSVEDVTKLVQSHGELNQQFAPVKKVLDQYGLGENTEEYLRNSEASLALVNQLISKGIIDEQGNIVEKKQEPEPKSKFQLPVTPPAEPSKADAAILKALKSIGERVEAIEEGQSNIYRRNISRDVKSLYPDLDDSDISQVLAIAQHDKSKSFWDHAKEASETKVAKVRQEKLTHAKDTIGLLVKAGIVPEGKVDLEKLDLDALSEYDPNTEPPVHEGKKFMFPSRMRKLGVKEGEFASPGDGMKEMIDGQKKW